MEIKKVDNEIINEYPKMKDFNKKDLKKYVPLKWSKIGLSSFVFGILMRTTKLKASEHIFSIDNEWLDGVGRVEIEGGIIREINPIYEISEKGTFIFSILTILLVVISIILTFVKKIKDKKGLNTKLTNKKLKILYIITGVSIVICMFLIILYNK